MLAVSVAGPQGWLLLTTEGEPEKDDAVRKWYASGTSGAGRNTSRRSSGRRRSAGRRRPSKVPRLRRRLPGSPTHGAGQARRPRRRRRNRSVSTSPNEAWSGRPPENLDVRTFVVDVGQFAGFTPAVARDRSGRATATSGLTFYQALRNNDMLKDSTMGGVCAVPFFAGCRPLGAPRIASAARRQIRKGRAGGRMRNKNGIRSNAARRTRGEPGRGAGTPGAAWGGICENGVLGAADSQFSAPESG